MTNLEASLFLELPELTGEEMALQNSLRTWRQPVRATGWTLKLGNVAVLDRPILLRAALFQGTIELYCARSMLDTVLETLQPGLRADNVAPDILALLLELAFEAPLIRWTGNQNIEFEVVGAVDKAVAQASDLVLKVNHDDLAWPLVARAQAPVLRMLLSKWPAARRPLDSLHVPVVLRLGTTDLTQELLRSLRLQDAVLIERLYAAPPQGLAIIGNLLAASVAMEAHGLRLTSAPALLPLKERQPMTADDQSSAQAKALNDIPIKLSFDLGETELTMRELGQLSKGSILQMSRSSEAPVLVRANGRPVGSGELVRVEGRLAVRLLRIFEHD